MSVVRDFFQWLRGNVPADQLQTYREQRLRNLGLSEVDDDGTEHDSTWIPVKSSNVYAIRWIDGKRMPMEVRFQTKDGGAGPIYEYEVDESTFDDMFGAPSKGKFVWEALRRPKVPYRRIS